jgi:hypothetical protein
MKVLTGRLAALGLAAAALLAAGCSSSSYSYVKVIHASAGAPNVDVEVGKTFAAQNLAFGNATSAYAKVPAGNNANIQVFAAGSDNTPVLTASQTLVKNQYYTVIALNTPAKLQAAVENDDLTPPTSGDCKLRVVHASTVAGPVDVYVTAPGVVINDPNNPVTPVLANFMFGTVTKYLQVPAGSYEVRVTATGNPSDVLIDTGAAGVPLTAGDIYTAVALDPNPTSTTAKPSLLLTQDQPVTGVTPVAPMM